VAHGPYWPSGSATDHAIVEETKIAKNSGTRSNTIVVLVVYFYQPKKVLFF
jgi:hypothetical protein